MKRKLLVPCFLNVAALSANASGYSHQEPLKLNVEEMPPVLTTTRTMTADLRETLPAPLPGISEHATRTKPHYTFIKDQTWVGIPIFLAGVVAKSEKKAFRQDYKNVHTNTRLITNFHSEADDYMQFVPMLGATALNIAGVEGRSDIFFKDTHLKRGELTTTHNIIENPSFFSISMGIGLGAKNLNFEVENLIDGMSTDNIDIKLQASTVVGAEGAYFFNKHIGVGGRLRVRSTPVKGWNEFMANAQNQTEEIINQYNTVDGFVNMVKDREFTIQSDHLTEFAGDVGIYFQLPLSKRLALGSKLLIGRSTMQELDLDAHFTGKIKDFHYDAIIKNGKLTEISNVKTEDSGKDYDFSKKTYTLKYDPYRYLETAIPLLTQLIELSGSSTDAQVYKRKRTCTHGLSAGRLPYHYKYEKKI